MRRPPAWCHWSSTPTTARRCRPRFRANSSPSDSSPADGEPPLVRSYSLSGSSTDPHYRISVKIEPHGAAGRFLHTAVDVGDHIKVAAPRGKFTLDEGTSAVTLVSAGIGVTPLLAILHALHDTNSTRDIWWLHAARNSAEHAFAEEVRSLLATMPTARSRVWYSRPGPDDRLGTDYDEFGHISAYGDHRVRGSH